MNDTSSHTVYSVKLGWMRCYLLKCTGGYLMMDTYPFEPKRDWNNEINNLPSVISKLEN